MSTHARSSFLGGANILDGGETPKNKVTCLLQVINLFRKGKNLLYIGNATFTALLSDLIYSDSIEMLSTKKVKPLLKNNISYVVADRLILLQIVLHAILNTSLSIYQALC